MVKLLLLILFSHQGNHLQNTNKHNHSIAVNFIKSTTNGTYYAHENISQIW
jgi:hypothetical protein